MNFELVEVWRNEFETIAESKSMMTEKNPDGDYMSSRTNLHWKGFLMAKRSQPVIELSKDDGSISQNAYQLEVIAMLRKQGYQYKVKE